MEQLTQHINIEVYPHDLGEFNWDDAVKVCNELGQGWRLPTREELHLMWLNNDGSFADACYWSSTDFSNNIAWSQYFLLGSQDFNDKDRTYYVRPVRYVKKKLYNTDYVIYDKANDMVYQDSRGMIVLYGDKTEADADCMKNEIVIPCTKLPMHWQNIIEKQINK